MRTLAEHAAGNYRALMIMAQTLLDAANQAEARQIDEELFLEVFAPHQAPVEPRPWQKSHRATAA